MKFLYGKAQMADWTTSTPLSVGQVLADNDQVYVAHRNFTQEEIDGGHKAAVAAGAGTAFYQPEAGDVFLAGDLPMTRGDKIYRRTADGEFSTTAAGGVLAFVAEEVDAVGTPTVLRHITS